MSAPAPKDPTGSRPACVQRCLLRGTCYRGVKTVFPSPQHHDPQRHFPVGSAIIWYEFKSTSERAELMYADHFCGMSGARTIFTIEAAQAYRISRLSAFGEDEAEVLFRPLTRLEVLSAAKLNDPLNATEASGGFPDSVALRQLAPCDESPAAAAAELMKLPLALQRCCRCCAPQEAQALADGGAGGVIHTAGGGNRKGSGFVPKDAKEEGNQMQKRPVLHSRLYVTVRRAQNLRKADVLLAGGRADPYVIVWLGAEKLGKTAVAWHDLSPVWEQTLSYECVGDLREKFPPEATLIFELKDKDRFRRDDSLGEVSISMQQLYKQALQNPLDAEYNVGPSLKCPQPRGTLCVRVLLTLQ